MGRSGEVGTMSHRTRTLRMQISVLDAVISSIRESNHFAIELGFRHPYDTKHFFSYDLQVIERKWESYMKALVEAYRYES